MTLSLKTAGGFLHLGNACGHRSPYQCEQQGRGEMGPLPTMFAIFSGASIIILKLKNLKKKTPPASHADILSIKPDIKTSSGSSCFSFN